MAEDEQKHKGRLAAAVLAGSALTFSSFAIGVPAAMADTTDGQQVEETPAPEPEESDATPTATAAASETPADSDDDEADDEDPEEDEKDDADDESASQDSDSDEGVPEDESASPLADGDDDSVAPGEQSLTADREQINLEDFIQDSSTDEDSGVNFTAEGFEPNSSVTYEVVSPGNVEGTDGTALTDENGTAQFYIFGYESASEPEVYLGEYTVTVSGESLDGETLETDPVSFTVVDEGGDDPEEPADPSEPIEISLSVNEGQAGDSVNVTGANFAAEEDVEVLLQDVSDEMAPVELATAIADADGNIDQDVTIPEGTADGDYNIVAVNTDGDDTAESFTVKSDNEDGEDDGAEQDAPRIEMASDEVYQGESLDVQLSNLTSKGKITVKWNPTETMTAESDGTLAAELPIADDADTGVQEITVTDETTGLFTTMKYTVLEADDQVTEPALIIDPEEITLDDFVGEPDDGAGVAHTVEGIEAGTEISYVVSGPEGVNDFEQTADVDDDGLVEFIIAGYDVSDPSVYLGDYTTVVTYEDENGENEELSGNFSVVTEDGETPGDDNTPGDSDNADDSDDPVDMNGEDLATTGANTAQLGWLAGGLLALGVAFFAHANRARLFGRKH